jgi:hypothetical protein
MFGFSRLGFDFATNHPSNRIGLALFATHPRLATLIGLSAFTSIASPSSSSSSSSSSYHFSSLPSKSPPLPPPLPALESL